MLYLRACDDEAVALFGPLLVIDGIGEGPELSDTDRAKGLNGAV